MATGQDIVNNSILSKSAMTLPVQQEAGAEEESTIKQKDPSPASTPVLSSEDTPPHLLLVEDNKINQKLALALLGKLGFSVDTAENGLEAITATNNNHYDLILMDMQMPEMGGIEATRHIRTQDGSNAHTPIVALTANAMESDHQACRDAGMDDFLTKPINREKLIACLARWVDHPPTISSS